MKLRSSRITSTTWRHRLRFDYFVMRLYLRNSRNLLQIFFISTKGKRLSSVASHFWGRRWRHSRRVSTVPNAAKRSSADSFIWHLINLRLSSMNQKPIIIFTELNHIIQLWNERNGQEQKKTHKNRSYVDQFLFYAKFSFPIFSFFLANETHIYLHTDYLLQNICYVDGEENQKHANSFEIRYRKWPFILAHL